MKNILWVLLLVGFVGCSNKTTQDSNTVSPTIKEIPVDEKLITADISVVPDPSNEFTMDIKTGQKVLNFEIKNNSPSNGAVKINLTYKNEITINNIGTTCGVSGYTRLNSNSSCMLSILVNSEVMNAGVLTYNFNIQEPTNGIISTYQNFISVLDPLGNGNVSFPGSSGTCKVNYHLESRSCKFNVKACVTLPPFALTGTQTWTGAGYGGCVITQCELGYDLANNTCSISTNPYELAAVNGNAATANHTVSFKSSHKNNYTFVATGTGGNYIERVMSDLNNDGVSDGNLSGLEGLVGTGNVSCGKNASSGFVECFLSAGRSITLASKPVSYDNVGDGSGLSSLPISLVDKLWSHGESQITGTAYTNVLMKDKTIYSFYGQGNSSIQKAIKVKYSLSADSTIDGDLIADNNTDNISYTSSNSASSTTIYSCVKSSGKIMCWYRQGNDVNQMALPVQIDTNSDGTGDSDLDASQVVKIIPTTGYTGLALMQSGQVYSWLTTGRGVQYARPVVLYNTTTPLVLNNVSEFATSFQRNCALTSDKIYCWLAQGLGANGATIVKADLNNDNVVDGDLDASLVEKSIPSHSNAYTYLLLKNGRILSFIGDGQSGTQSARYILNAITGLPQESMSFPFSSGKTYTCGIYNKKNIYCFYGQSQVGGGSPVLYDSDGDFIGDTPFDIDDNNPLQRRIIINKTANQGSVDVKDLATNNVLGTCASTLATCTILVPDESNISIVSTALDGYNFVNYTDPKCLGTNATCNLTAINSNVTVTPIFSAINYKVIVNVLPANLASDVSFVIRRASVVCSGTCLDTYNKGMALSIVATPSKYVNNAIFDVSGTGLTNINIVTANQLTLNVGTSDVVVNVNLSDKELTVPTFSFNGTLSGSIITIANNPLKITTSNITMAREILISETANCSTGSYVAYASTIDYTHSVQLGTNPVSFMFKNNSQVSPCYPYSLKMTNVTQLCNPQPTNSVAQSGNQVSTDGGITWGLCTGFTCIPTYHVSGNTCAADVISCPISGGAGIGNQTWNGSAYGSCILTSCYNGYHQNGNTCESNNQSCIVDNGSGYKTWNNSTLSYGSCYATSCTGPYVPYNGICVIPKYQSCIPQPVGTVNGNQVSYDNGISYQACTGYTCSSTYHFEGATCMPNTRTQTCGGTLPANASYNSGSNTYTQQYVGGDWQTIINTNYATSGICSFQCTGTNVYSSENNTCRVVGTSLWLGAVFETGEVFGTGTDARFFSISSMGWDSSSNTLLLVDRNQIKRANATTGAVTPGLGNGQGPLSQQERDGCGTSTRLSNNYLVMSKNVPGQGYIAGTEFNNGNPFIRKITTSANCISTYLGSKQPVYVGGHNATFQKDSSVSGFVGLMAVDSNETIYWTDGTIGAIYKMTSSGVISWFAYEGGTVYGFQSGASDMVADTNNNLFVIAYNGAAIYKINPSGTKTVFINQFYSSSMSIDSSNNLYVVDSVNNVIKKVTPSGVISTLPGNYGGQGIRRALMAPNGVLYVLVANGVYRTTF